MSLAPPINNLSELIKLGKGRKNYTNIDMKMLRRILPDIEELNNLIGLSDIKTSITKQLMYYISHFHLAKEDSFLYKSVEKQGTLTGRRTRKRASDSDMVSVSKRKKHNPSNKRKRGGRGRSSSSSSSPSKKRRRCSSDNEESSSSEEEEEDSSEEDEDATEDDNDIIAFFAGIKKEKEKDIISSAPENPNAEYMNMVIYGNAGVGKSLVGSIIGKIFHKMGIFKTKKCKTPFRIIHADDLIGGYLGQTGMKTRGVLEKSKGGTLMLDEAYGLNGSAEHSSHDMYASNAIDTITAFLSENKDDICFILAGYEDDIKNRIFPLNKGLERRFPWVHKIAGYSSKELADIFLYKINNTGWLTNVSNKTLYELFEDRRSLFKNQAGDVERLFSEAKIIHAHRTFSSHPSLRKIISLKDIEDGMNRLANDRAGGGLKEPPPFMYM